MNSLTVAPLLDRQLALSRAGGDLDLLREIARLFVENYALWIEEIRAAISRDDGPGLERSAHGLKGSVSNFGARAVVEAAHRLELIGRGQEFSEVAQVFRTLELALAALRPELETL